MDEVIIINILEEAKRIIDIEALALKDLSIQIGDEFAKVIEVIANVEGKVVVVGVGKSGHIGQKIAATLSSTGTPSFFMHAAEGLHGDLGMIEKKDIVILISNSGETSELVSLLPSLNQIKPVTIALTSNKYSTLAKAANYSLIYQYDKEADYLNVAPTTSSTLTLAIGDALAGTVAKLKAFDKENFHLYHPGGSLGKQLEKRYK